MKVIEVIEKTVRVDNSDNAERQYKVEARVRLSNNIITDVQAGTVRTLDNDVQLCHFSGYENLTVQFGGMPEDRAAVFAAIDEFENALNAEEI